jgi:ubiquinone/menaquinone biosynthesis C-methylase UbiE
MGNETLETSAFSSCAAKRDFFDALAPKWKANLSAEDQAFLAAALHRLDTPPSAGTRVLDLGCGSGVLFPFYAGWSISACDISGEMLRRARESASSDVVEFVQADVHALPFSDAIFARVAMLSMLPHADDPELALSECFRVLKPGGTLSIVHLESAERIKAIHARLGGAVGADTLPEIEVLNRLLEAIGFKVEFSEATPRYLSLSRKPL